MFCLDSSSQVSQSLRKMPTPRGIRLITALTCLLSVADPTSLDAQHPVEGTEWSVHILRPSGQPVAPIFEGWWQNPDGTYDLSFGYFNLNTEEAIDIPIGPDNFIEPAAFNGAQPTHFDPVPSDGRGSRRFFGVFTVTVPADIGDQRVVWTLRNRGQAFSVPGHIRSTGYMIDAVETDGRGTSAPVLTFDPVGSEGRGPRGLSTGPLTTAVGTPLQLSVRVNADPRPRSLVWWFKHQGPGTVTFSLPGSSVGQGLTEVTTTAMFSEPGDYVVRVTAVESVGTIEFHCCWTNGYIQVTVTP